MEIIQSTLGIILIIVTSHGNIDPEHPTGLWLEEFAVPYEVFTEAGYEVVVASPKGGEAPVDPRSLPEKPSEAELKAMKILKTTVPLKQIPNQPYEGVFFSGGHGTMFDFPDNPEIQKILRTKLEEGKPVALVCHGPAALAGATGSDGEPLVKGRTVTAFTNEEEHAVELADEMPFLLETRLQKEGARFVSVKKFQANVVEDGNLITGQNPTSSRKTAEALLKQLQKK
jgi:putative intracellular protease/amidase